MSEEFLKKYQDFDGERRQITDEIEKDRKFAIWFEYEDKELEKYLAQILDNSQ